MADKQFARSGPAELDTLADDDPLSELARIVGYDARPAVQQLQELQRHQEAIRRDPAFDLEEELLRAFDSYDAPRAEPVHPDSGLIEHPLADDAVVAPAVAAALDDAAAAIEPQAEPAVVSFEQSADALAPVEPVSDVADSIEQPAEAAIEQAAEFPAAEVIDSSFDLERELELSLGHEDLAPEPAPQPEAVPQIDDRAHLATAFEAGGPAVYEDWQEPLASKLAAAGKATERVEISEPVYVDMADALAAQAADVALNEGFAFDALPAAPADLHASEIADRQTTDAEHLPVSAVTADDAASVSARPSVTAAPAPAAKKSSYPFTPMFSRATPVASPAGGVQQRAFATPLAAPAVAEVPVVEPVVAPQAMPESGLVQGKPGEAESEPNFDIENFELELADIALDMDLSEDAPSTAAVEMPAQPAVTHPALVDAAAQPFLQALAKPNVPEQYREDRREERVAEAVEAAPTDNALPFDPAMIGETETGVAPIADLDVPQLPAIEAEEKPSSYSSDFDLDIDAEMAQLFATPARAAKDGPHLTDTDVAGSVRTASSSSAEAPLASIDDFAEFEKAMEEDFRRSLEQRRGAAQHVDHLAALPGDDYAGEEGYGRRSQRSMLLAASVAGAIILGGAAVYAWMGGSSAALTGDGPTIILADKEPVKVVPEEKGGKTVPNQDKAVYDRVAGGQVDAPRQQALVSTTEEPMDVAQRTLTPENLPFEGNDYDDTLPGVSASEEEETARLLPDDAGNAIAEDERTPAVAPRKVRTMIVKPDGTLVAREEPSAAPAIPASVSADAGASGAEGRAVVAVAKSDLGAAEPPAAGSEKVALAAPSNGSVEELTPVRSVTTTAVGGAPAAVPQARPEKPASGTAQNQAPVEAAAAAASAPIATASVPPGSYVVQIASLPSEAEAQKSYDSLSRKFGEIIGGRGVDIRKAEIAGKGTYYRVRIPAGSREEANALCSRYKDAGGSCLVTK